MDDQIDGYYICVDDRICPFTSEILQTVQVRCYGFRSEYSVLAGESFDRVIEFFEVDGDLKGAIDAAKTWYPKAKYEGEQRGKPIQNHKMSDVAPSWFDPADAGEEW